MKYFLANLAVHLAVTLVFVILSVVFSNRNKRGKTKNPFAYFLPVIFCAIAVVYTFFYTAPRLLDFAAVKSDNYYSYTGTLENVSGLNNSLTVDGHKYYINPLRSIPEEGSNVKVRYTKYGHYVVEIVIAEEMDVEGSIDEENSTSLTSMDE